MHRRIILFAAVLVAATFVPVVATASADDGSPNQDYVVGGGQNNPANGVINHFAIAAHSDPNGDNPFGQGLFVDTASGPPIHAFMGDVVCLRVDGNRASVLLAVDHGLNQPPALDDGGDLMFFEDNGGPVNGQSPDRMINQRLNAAQLQAQETAGCPAPKAISPDRTLSAGNIVVHDAQ